MALNIAVPLSGVGDFFEGYGLLSPISPISVDCRENLKLLVSPLGSESSGVSSLDPEESKEKKSPEKVLDDDEFFEEKEIENVKNCINYQGRDLLDMESNLSYKNWGYRAAELPDNNFKMFLANRSQYHRLANSSGHIQDYSMVKCQCCDFRYPVNLYAFNVTGAINNNATTYTQNFYENTPSETANNNINTIKYSPQQNSYGRYSQSYNKNHFEYNAMPYSDGNYDNFKQFIDYFRATS